MRRYGMLCLLLALLLVLPLAVSCSKQGEKPNPNNPAESITQGDGTETEPQPGEEDREPDIRFDTDGVPAVFNLAVRQGRYHYLYCDDANTSDTVQYSVFQRNSAICDKYGVDIRLVEIADGNAGAEWVTKINAAGTGDMDLLCWDYWWALEQQGVFADLRTLEELDLEKSWYYQGWNDNVTINGITYSCVGDAALEVLENLEVLFFNKSMASANELDLYATVDDGDWTLEEMMRINSLMAQNLDDDDTSNDVYGALYDVHSLRSGLFAAGLKIVTVSQENGAIAVTLNTQNNINLCDKFSEMLNSAEVRYEKTTARVTSLKPFINGQTFFLASCLYRGGTDLKGSDLDYGIITAPKYSSEDPYVSASYGVSVFSIPKFCTDSTMSAVILDAMNRRSNDTIVQAFYENVIKGKVADSPDDSRMIDNARDWLYADFAFVSESDNFDILMKIQTAVIRNESLATVIGGYVETARNQLEALIEIYR